ncbi:hypothetical protein BH09MYX1_BH09MYX1_42620 [soil metagenome]
MATIEITQRLMSMSAEYDVRKDKSETPTQFVKGELITTSPMLRLRDTKSKDLIATLKGNVLKTRFQIRSPKDDELALVNFSAVAFRKTFTMSVNGKGFHASAGVVGVVKDIYECKDNDGKIALMITKEPGVRDRFVIETKDEDAVPQDIAVLVAISVHCRFYE